MEQGITHLQILIRSLLPLAVHGSRWLAAKRADGHEHDQADTNSNPSVQSDCPALSRGILSSGSVRTKGDVVSCSAVSKLVHSSLCPQSNIVPSNSILQERKGLYAPAFFSWWVNSDQLAFIRSRSDIHRSACSCGGIVSHRFSMSASVGFEIACAALAWTGLISIGAAARAELRRIEVRSIVGLGRGSGR